VNVTATLTTWRRLRAVDVMSSPTVTIWPVGSCWDPWPVMTRRCVLPDTDLQQVADLMMCDSVDIVPVVDDHGRLVGVVTVTDLTAAVAHFGIAEETACTCD
jgi:CBS-domain-containing membrane protein